jgi:hypothetical protein
MCFHGYVGNFANTILYKYRKELPTYASTTDKEINVTGGFTVSFTGSVLQILKSFYSDLFCLCQCMYNLQW